MMRVNSVTDSDPLSLPSRVHKPGQCKRSLPHIPLVTSGKDEIHGTLVLTSLPILIKLPIGNDGKKRSRAAGRLLTVEDLRLRSGIATNYAT
jgi:hypothetical protein